MTKLRLKSTCSANSPNLMEVLQSVMITKKGNNSQPVTVTITTLRGAVIIQSAENMKIDEEISLITAVIVTVKTSLLLVRIVTVASVTVETSVVISSMVLLEEDMALQGETASATLEVGVQTIVVMAATTLTIDEATPETTRILLAAVVLTQTALIITTTRATINKPVDQMT